MLYSEDLDKIFGYGAQLDAWAAVVSRRLGIMVPEYRVALEENVQQELAHNRVLAALYRGKHYLPLEYATEIGRSAQSDDPRWNATLLNFVERRSEVQFRMAWRLTRNGDLLQIASDEHRHVKLGREIMRHLGVTRDLVERVMGFVDQADRAHHTTDDTLGLAYLNQKVLRETLDSISR